MAHLEPPTALVRASFLAAMAEDEAEGKASAARLRSQYGDNLGTPDGFERYLQDLRDRETDGPALPAGHVPGTTLWWVTGTEYLGRISIRHRLTPALRALGGHIGYDVRPSARRHGHATAMLRAALPVALALGIDPALLTCDDDNVASRKVIEANGGRLERQHDNVLYFWVPTCGSRG